MAEYYVVLKRAVAAFDPGAGDQRRTVYDKARSALIGQLKAIDPPLTTAEISRQRLELEEAIRRVERESINGSPSPLLQDLKSAKKTAKKAPVVEDDDDEDEPAIELDLDLADDEEDEPPPPPRKRKAAPLPPEPVRAVKARTRKITEPPPPDDDDDYFEEEEEEPAPPPPRRRGLRLSTPVADLRPDRASDRDQSGRSEPALDTRDEWSMPSPDLGGERRPDREGGRGSRGAPRISDHDGEEPRPRRSRLPLIFLLVLLMAAGGGAAAFYFKVPQVRSFLASVGVDDIRAFANSIISSFNSPATNAPGSAADKTPDRAASGPAPTVRTVGGQGSTVAPPAPAPTVRTAGQPVAVAQSALLFEESMQRDGNVIGNSEGTVVWRYVENGTDGPSIEGNVAIPSKNLTMQLSIRRNTDKAIPASHLLEVVVKTPPEFGGGGVVEVPRIVTKNADSSKTTPIAGAPYKVADGLFWILMSNPAKDVAANMAAFKTGAFIDVPLVYKSGQRAIMTLMKGEPGDQVFNRAVAAWGG